MEGGGGGGEQQNPPRQVENVLNCPGEMGLMLFFRGRDHTM